MSYYGVGLNRMRVRESFDSPASKKRRAHSTVYTRYILPSNSVTQVAVRGRDDTDIALSGRKDTAIGIYGRNDTRIVLLGRVSR